MRRHYNNNSSSSSGNKNNNNNNNKRGLLPSSEMGAVTVDPDKLLAAMRPLRSLLDYAAALPVARRAGFCGADWARIVLGLIVAFRCSFPLPPSILSTSSSSSSGGGGSRSAPNPNSWSSCAFDWATARRILDLGAHLEKLGEGDGSGDNNGDDSKSPDEEEKEGDGDSRRRKVDISTTAVMRVVLRSVKAKFDKKIAAFDAAAAAASAHAVNMEEQSRVGIEVCPMFNGTLSQYLSTWDGQQQPTGVTTGDFGFSADSSSLSMAMSHDTLSSQSVSSGAGGMPDLTAAAPVDFPSVLPRPAPYNDRKQFFRSYIFLLLPFITSFGA